jgi:acyl carrier protein
MTTLETIKSLFVEMFDYSEEVLVPDATLDNLGLDSLDKIQFVFALEDEFNISIPESELKIQTLQEFVALVERLVAEQAGASN